MRAYVLPSSPVVSLKLDVLGGDIVHLFVNCSEAESGAPVFQ